MLVIDDRGKFNLWVDLDFLHLTRIYIRFAGEMHSPK